MAFTALERLLATERVRQRAAQQGGFSIPAMHERAVSADQGPFLVTNMRGQFLPTRVSQTGVVRYGFSHVPVGTDDRLLSELYCTLIMRSHPETAGNRCKTIQEAITRLQSFGHAPRTVVVSPSLLGEIAPGLTLESAWEAMRTTSQVAEVNEMLVLLADLPDGAALVGTAPALVGTYTRIADYVGLLLQRVDQTLAVVTSDVA